MFECKSCGGKTVYIIEKSALQCLYCGTVFPVDDFDEKTANNATVYQTNVFVCRSCGAELSTPDNQTVSFCSYCGSQSVLYEKTTDNARPQSIIPFRLSKKAVHTQYTNKLSGVWYLPKEFKDSRFIDSMRGIYIPFWSNSVDFQPNFRLRLERQVELGGNQYREETYTGTFNAANDRARYYTDASSALDDNITEQLLPYPTEKEIPFNPAYLAGFYADRADVPPQKYIPELTRKASEDALQAVEQAMPGYKVSKDTYGNPTDYPNGIPACCRDYHASLLPVWFLTRRDKNRVSYAVVNGYDGKMYVDLPVDSGKYWLVTLLMAVGLFAILSLVVSLTAQTSLGWCCVMTTIMMLAYQRELRTVMERETHLFDVGSPLYDPAKAEAARKKKKKSSGLGVLITLVIVLGPWIVTFLNGGSMPLKAVQLLFSVIIGGAQMIKILDSGSRIKEKGMMLVGIFSFLSILAAVLLLVVLPVSDYWYYGGCLLCLAGALLPSLCMIRCYNLTASHPLPSYFARQGGLNDAK